MQVVAVQHSDLFFSRVSAFLLYTLNVAFAFALLSSLYGDFMQAVGASVRIFDLFDRKPDVPCEGGMQLVNIDGGKTNQWQHTLYFSTIESKLEFCRALIFIVKYNL